jgi:hypothetical protein
MAYGGSAEPGVLEMNVIHWFGMSPDFADLVIPYRPDPPHPVRINMTLSAYQCERLGYEGSSTIEAELAEDGVSFVQLEWHKADSGIMFMLDPMTDHRSLASMSSADRTSILQVLAAETRSSTYLSNGLKFEQLAPETTCGTCPGRSICSGSSNVGVGGCVCPAKTAWYIDEAGALDCAAADLLTISNIIPGMPEAATRSADTWQRGATAELRWTAEGEAIPLVVEILATNSHGTVVAEPIRHSLSADQVAAGSFSLALPVTFAPTAVAANVGFLTQAAVDHAPHTAVGRYLIRGRHFFLRNAGCIADSEHGECRAFAACGGTADPHRASGGAGSCESLGVETEAKTCCLIRDEPFPLLSDYSFSSPDILSPGVAVVDGRAILDGGSAHAYMGQTQKIRFAVMSENEVEAPWSLYHVADLTDEQASDPAWLAQSADRGGLVVRVASSDADGSTVESMHASTYRPGVFAVLHSIDYTFTALNAHSLSVHSQRFVLVQAGEAVVPVAFIDVEYAPCVPEPEFDWSNLAFTDRNYVGVCAPREACEDAGGIIVDAGLWGDDSSNCAPDLGKAVCCRYQWGVVNSGFRAAVSGDDGTGLSVGVIVALAAGALCLLLACVALTCSALFLSRRRSAKQVALATAHQHAQQVSSGSARYKSRSRRASVQLRH